MSNSICGMRAEDAEGPSSLRPGTHGDSDFDDSMLRELSRTTPVIPMPLPGDRLGGLDGQRYEVLGLLGGGGMGQVFRALDHALQRNVALKFLVPRKGLAAPELLACLREEAQAIARLDHENIVRIHDVSEWSPKLTPEGLREAPRVPFLVMECLEGESLHHVLRHERPDLRHALEWMTDVAEGLAHAHERNLIHRDLKPANVFVLSDGRVKLLDFGLARSLVRVSPPDVDLAPGGTPAYMAPEQWRDEPPDARADVWAAGLLLFELLTGEHPLPRAPPRELRLRIPSTERMPSVRERRPDVPEELDRLVASMLAKDPVARPASGTELAARLREAREHLLLSPQGGARGGSFERRLVTLVSCRLALAPGGVGALDPEDCNELEAAFHRACTRIVRQEGGTLTLAVGAEVLACFGSPVTREDDSERAVRAALHLRDLLPRELAGLGTAGVAVKLGLHTDRVALAEAVPSLHGVAQAIQGEAPKVAGWLASQADAGTVLLSESTHALMRGGIQSRALGARAFDGLAGTSWLGVHEVLGELRAASRFDRSLVFGTLTPLVGREDELRRLSGYGHEALEEGRGLLVLLRGEAGIGKSRLVQELHDRGVPGTSDWVRCQCWLRDSGSAFHPLIDCLQRHLGFAPEVAPVRDVSMLEDRLEELGLPADYLAPLAFILSLPIPGGSPFRQLSRERKRTAALDALVDILQREAARRPLVLVVEDVHWADPSTLQFLGVLLAHLESMRMCVLLTARPEFEHDWTSHPRFCSLDVEPLRPDATQALVRKVAEGRTLAEATVARLAAGTDGIPLFIEELTRAVLGRGAPDRDAPGASSFPVPASLHELLLARLDALPPRQRAQARLAATLGREFSYEMLRAVSFLREDELRPELEGLERAGLLFRQEAPPVTTYAFKHALIQEAAYQSLLRSTRQRYHVRIVQVLTEQFPELAEEQPEVLAQHSMLGGLTEQAVEHWQRAGQLAGAKSAFPEAVGHYSRALAQLSLLPASPERDRREIALCSDLGQALVSLRGFASKEVEEVYARARALSGPCDDVPLPVLWGLWNIALLRGDHEGTDALVARFQRLLAGPGDLETRVVLHGALACWTFWRGDYAGSRRHGLEVKALLDGHVAAEFLVQIRGGRRGHVAEQLLQGYLYLALSEMVMGWVDRARITYAEALVIAESMHHPYAFATALMFGATMACESGDATATLGVAEQAVELSRRCGFPFILADTSCLHGWATAHLGDVRTGIQRLHEGLAQLRTMGATLIYASCLGGLARAHLVAGEFDEGLAVVREALTLLEGVLSRYQGPELLRVQGELLLRKGEVGSARASLEQALAEARASGARLSELRATLGLARLLCQMGEREEARAVLEALKDALIEGGDLEDHQAARKLLAELT